MSTELLRVVASNALLAAILAAAVAAFSGRLRWPAAVHLMWLAVLLRMLLPPILPLPLLRAAAAPAATGLVTLSRGASAPAARTGASTLGWLELVTFAWLAGAAAVALLAAVRLARLRRTLAVARPAPPHIAERLERLAASMRVRPPLLLLVAARVPPMLWGVGRARLILPEGLVARLAPAQLDALLAHELAHLTRRDHWVRWFELAVTVACWWNPVTWWAAARLRQAEERCCDALVLRRLPDHARAYADTLVAALRYLAVRRPVVPTGAVCMADLSEIQRRLEMILTPSHRRPSIVAIAVLVLFLGAALAVTPLLAAHEDPAREDLPEAFSEPITLHLEEADLYHVLRLFAQLTDTELAVPPGIEGRVSADLTNVPAAEALDLVLRLHDLGWRLTGERLEVLPLDPTQGAGDVEVLRSGRLLEDGSIVEAIVRRPHRTTEGGAPNLVGELRGGSPYRVEGDGMTAPTRIAGAPPSYPEDARAEGVNGLVILDALIDAQGRVTDVKILRSPDDRLSRAAMIAVLDWVFEPATIDGRPVPVAYQATFRFALD